jgi:hypothetical protein
MPTTRGGSVTGADAPPAPKRYKVLKDINYYTSWDTAWHHQSEFGIRCGGTFRSLESANRAAESELMGEFTRENFDEKYEVTRDAEGLVTVDAKGMEGTSFKVWVEEIKGER